MKHGEELVIFHDEILLNINKKFKHFKIIKSLQEGNTAITIIKY
jgi:hypothetical protein